MLTRERLLERARAGAAVEVPVPELGAGEAVLVRRLSVAEQFEYERACQDGSPPGEDRIDPQRALALMFAASVVGPDGERLFPWDAGPEAGEEGRRKRLAEVVAEVSSLPVSIVTRVAQEARRVNRTRAEDLEDARKN